MNAPLGYIGDQPSQRLIPAEPIVRLERISKTFPGRNGQPVTALREVDLSVQRGSILGVIGRSGAGKSTLIRLVNGLEKPTKGKVVSVGPGALGDKGQRHAIPLKSGDNVYYGKWSGTEVEVDGTKFVILKETDVLGVLE